ncbi:MAG: hypothetical protein ACD_12C00292G0001, partial [uncultured bacterium]
IYVLDAYPCIVYNYKLLIQRSQEEKVVRNFSKITLKVSKYRDRDKNGIFWLKI